MVYWNVHRLLDLQFRLAARVELIHCLKLEVKFLQLVEPWGARLHCRDNLTQRALIDRLDKKVLMYFYLSIYPSMYLTIQLSIDPSIHLSIYQSIYHSIHPSIYQSNRSSWQEGPPWCGWVQPDLRTTSCLAPASWAHPALTSCAGSAQARSCGMPKWAWLTGKSFDKQQQI